MGPGVEAFVAQLALRVVLHGDRLDSGRTQDEIGNEHLATGSRKKHCGQSSSFVKWPW